MARLYHTQFANIELDKILGVSAFELAAKLEVDPAFLDDVEHEHDDEVASFVLRTDRPVDMNRFMEWFNGVLLEHGEDVYRTKGIFRARGYSERLVFQSVRMLTSLRREENREPEEPRHSEYVVIGRNLDRDKFMQALPNALCPANEGPLSGSISSVFALVEDMALLASGCRNIRKAFREVADQDGSRQPQTPVHEPFDS